MKTAAIKLIVPSGQEQALESALRQATFCSETIFGKAKFRMDTRCEVSNHEATIDTASIVGQHLTALAIGFLTQQLGEEGFAVVRTEASWTPVMEKRQ